jgi:uncharacterized membrane protein
MNVALWIVQGILALLFLFAGGTKLVLSKETLESMSPPNAIQLPFALVRFLGVVEVLGALGLILPGLTRIRRSLTPLAAVGLLIIMIGAVVVSFMGLGVSAAVFPLIAGVLCAFVACERRDWR